MLKVSVSIDVPNLDHATRFYVDAVGCTKLRDQGKSMVVLSAGNADIYLLQTEEASNPTPALSKIQSRSNATSNAISNARTFERHWTPVHLDFLVNDVEDAVAKIELAGGSRESGEEGEWGAIAHCADPFGNGFCFIRE